MPLELKVPEIGESITEVMIGLWKKREGDTVALDEVILEIESDKATVELPAPQAGTLTKVLKGSGEKAVVGEVIGYLEPSGVAASAVSAAPAPQSAASQPVVDVKRREGRTDIGSVQPMRVMPAAARVLGEAGMAASAAAGTGPGGRVTKADAVAAVAKLTAPAPQAAAMVPVKAGGSGPVGAGGRSLASSREERYVLISPIRQRIADRLVEAQQQAALLTTFNEVDMTAVMSLRTKFKDVFLERHGVKLGFMSFFVRAAVEALRAVPQVNAEYREPHIVYRDYCDIGIAVGGGKGLVVPVLRNAETMSFAQIELAINDFARRAADNKLKLDELQGGTFTISNGGVYGSMMSTPIINPPQSGILGLHAIQDRPMAVNGQVVIRPMMYLALTYDHRIVDGREAVTFLKRIKDTIEDPTRLMLEV
ncbi:MAG: 2-oxoglutarate dehydrogenase complex dihydrolipoyllysine-residue succinyltransferase [Planctomycetota bacterium]